MHIKGAQKEKIKKTTIINKHSETEIVNPSKNKNTVPVTISQIPSTMSFSFFIKLNMAIP